MRVRVIERQGFWKRLVCFVVGHAMRWIRDESRELEVGLSKRVGVYQCQCCGAFGDGLPKAAAILRSRVLE